MPSIGALAQRQDGDSIVPPGDEKYKTGVYYRITTLLFKNVELAGFMTGQERSSIDVPKEVYDSVSGNTYTVTSVAVDAFKGQKILKSVTLPPTVTRIGAGSFEDCSIETLTIPGSVYHVDEAAFAGNPLKTITIEIPGENGAIMNEHSIELGDRAFGSADDPSLSDVYIHYDNPPIVLDGRKPFPYVAANHGSATLHLNPTAKADDYKNDYCWADFFVPAGIEEVGLDTDSNAPEEYFNLTGLKVSADRLTPGIYIMRQGDTVKKVYVR